MTFVKDVDIGFREKIRRLAAADGLEIRAGWLSGRPKYPKRRGGTAVAKVAGVQFGWATLSQVWDANEAELDMMIKSAENQIVKFGADSRREIKQIGKFLIRTIKARVRSMGLVDEEILIGDVKAALYARMLPAGGRKTKTGWGRPKLIEVIASAG